MKKILYLVSLLFCFNSLTAQQIIMSVSDGSVSCNGGADGTATVILNGVGTPPGFTYLVEHYNGAIWFQVELSAIPTGVSTFDITGLSAGLFRVGVVENIHAPIGFVVFQPAPITATASFTQTDILCNGGIDGSAIVNFFGGVTDYTFSWGTFTYPLSGGISFFQTPNLLETHAQGKRDSQNRTTAETDFRSNQADFWTFLLFGYY